MDRPAPAETEQAWNDSHSVADGGDDVYFRPVPKRTNQGDGQTQQIDDFCCKRCDILSYVLYIFRKPSFHPSIVLSLLNCRGEYRGIIMRDLGGRFIGYLIIADRLKNLVSIEWR